MVACSVEKPKKLSWWPIKRVGIRNGILVAENFWVQYWWKLALCWNWWVADMDISFNILSCLKAISGKLDFHVRGENAWLLATPYIGKGCLKTIGRCMLLHFNVCFGACSQADNGMNDPWFWKETLGFKPRCSNLEEAPSHWWLCLLFLYSSLHAGWLHSVAESCQVLVYPRNKAMGLNLGMHRTQIWVVINNTKKSLSEYLGQNQCWCYLPSALKWEANSYVSAYRLWEVCPPQIIIIIIVRKMNLVQVQP